MSGDSKKAAAGEHQESEPNIANCVTNANAGEHGTSRLSRTNCTESTQSHTNRQNIIDDGKRDSDGVPA